MFVQKRFERFRKQTWFKSLGVFGGGRIERWMRCVVTGKSKVKRLYWRELNDFTDFEQL